ncbi:hypothetical protein SDC9_104054 [bioreactor metagenome]|uniref:Uncharacterized protein n=1 Tax=bioreactor metagenome TaxID=1076179 RepID=A0A645AVF1_9ZZZZ
MNIIIIPPNTIIISLFALKNVPKAFNDDPSIKNVIEIPNVKHIVFLNKALLAKLPLFKFSTLLLDNILKYIGSIGNMHGDKNDNKPSTNTTIKFIFSIELS